MQNEHQVGDQSPPATEEARRGEGAQQQAGAQRPLHRKGCQKSGIGPHRIPASESGHGGTHRLGCYPPADGPVAADSGGELIQRMGVVQWHWQQIALLCQRDEVGAKLLVVVAGGAIIESGHPLSGGGPGHHPEHQRLGQKAR